MLFILRLRHVINVDSEVVCHLMCEWHHMKILLAIIAIHWKWTAHESRVFLS